MAAKCSRVALLFLTLLFAAPVLGQRTLAPRTSEAADPRTTTTPGARITVTDRARTTVTRIDGSTTGRRNDFTCTASCGNAGNVGNGKCNNPNNNCGCDWDGGDCCGAGNDYSSCTPGSDGTCCFDPTFRGTTTEDPSGRSTTSRGSPGDRTSATEVRTRPPATTTQLTRRQVTDGVTRVSVEPTRASTTTTGRFDGGFDCLGTCGNEGTLRNSKCNTANNNCGCNWDDGDCCGAGNDYSACVAGSDGTCCLDPDYVPARTTTTSRAGVARTSQGPPTRPPVEPDTTDLTRYDQTDPSRSTTIPATRDTTSTTSRRSTFDCSGVCGNAGTQGNGKCNNVNNLCGCDWDGGDCCGAGNDYSACTVQDDGSCCRDPTFRSTTTAAVTRPGGDPVRTSATVPDRTLSDTSSTYTITRGIVTDPTRPDEATRDDSTTTSRDNAFGCNGACGNSGNKGNGKCNTVNNLCGCDWDGGDCCGVGNDYSACTPGADGSCCLDPTYRSTTTIQTTTRGPEVGMSQKFSVVNANSCVRKFSCFGTSCSKIISKAAASGVTYTFDYLTQKFGCDCTGCGYEGGNFVIPDMN